MKHKSQAYHEKKHTATAHRRSAKQAKKAEARRAYKKEVPRSQRVSGNQISYPLFGHLFSGFDVRKFKSAKQAA